MVGAGLLTDAAGNRVELSSLPDNFDPEAISDIIGRQETGRQRILNTTAERPPRAAAPPNPNAVTPEARFQDDLRAQLSRAVNAERSRLATAAENDPNRFNPDFQPQLEPDAQAVERTVLEAMRRTGSQEEISFIDARLAQLGGGGGGGGGGGANPEADQALADAISDADDPAQELQDLGVTGERAARVLALIGG